MLGCLCLNIYYVVLLSFLFLQQRPRDLGGREARGARERALVADERGQH